MEKEKIHNSFKLTKTPKQEKDSFAKVHSSFKLTKTPKEDKKKDDKIHSSFKLTKSPKHSEVEVLDLENDTETTKTQKLKEKKQPKQKKKMSKTKKILIIVFVALFLLGSGTGLFLLYGPWSGFRNWLITTAMTTMNHQYLATWFYSDNTIQTTLDNNKVIESGEDTNSELIEFVDYDNTIITYKNKYDKEILTKEEGNDLYKVIPISGAGLRGYLVAIYDPYKVKIGTSAYMGRSGQMLTTIASNNNAVVAMNASGFFDPEYNSNGGVPHGMVIKDGRLVSNEERLPNGGGMIGFNNDNVLVLSRMSAYQALASGIRDAIEFGPFLIVNGTPSFIRGNGGWGDAPRSAIGQRKDGIVLFLVMDGRDYANGILGADMVEMTEILTNYGAYNAANLDGGTSSGLVVNGSLINKPVNGAGQNQTRAIPNAWIVTP